MKNKDSEERMKLERDAFIVIYRYVYFTSYWHTISYIRFVFDDAKFW